MLAEETLLNSQSNRALTCHRGGSAPSLHSASQPAQPLESVWAAGTANPSTSFQLCSRLSWRGGWEDSQINSLPVRLGSWYVPHTFPISPYLCGSGKLPERSLATVKKKQTSNQTTNKNPTKHFKAAVLPFTCHKTILYVLHSASAIRNCSL